MEHHCLSLLLILYGSEIVQGYCYMEWFKPVDCVKGEYCCKIGRHSRCCKDGDPTPSVMAIIGWVIFGLILLVGLVFLCLKIWPLVVRDSCLRTRRQRHPDHQSVSQSVN